MKVKKVKSLIHVRATLCDPMDCSLSGSSVHGIFQARVLEWVATSFSRGSSWPRDQTLVSRIVGGFFLPSEPPGSILCSNVWEPKINRLENYGMQWFLCSMQGSSNSTLDEKFVWPLEMGTMTRHGISRKSIQLNLRRKLISVAFSVGQFMSRIPFILTYFKINFCRYLAF